jgi:FMN phosphatase YigB (HAD superfamily)
VDESARNRRDPSARHFVTRRLKAVVFDVGETLVDETAIWERASDASAIPRFTLMGVLGGLAARGEPHTRVWEVLGIERPEIPALGGLDFYPDALPCVSRLRSSGLRVGAVGNTPRSAEHHLRPHVDFVGSSARWGVEKPEREFFELVIRECGCPNREIAYVGDRVDNDVVPALAAGMAAVHVRRGPWGYLHDPPREALSIRSLDELPDALASLT